MPDPLGPTNPKVSPFGTVSDISCKISTDPAFPIKDSDTFDRDNTGSFIGQAFGQLRIFGYGAVCGVRNLCLATLLMTSAAMADDVVIAALGDSLTQGFGLPNGQGFVPQLDAWLDGQGLAVDLRNAGVSGDTTAGGLSRVDWTLTDDVDGMIVALGGNDYLRGLDPALSRANLQGILEAAAAKGVPVMLVGIRAGGNYGPDYKAAFDAMYVDLAQDFDAALFPEFFEGLREDQQAGDLAQYMQADGIHPNADGVIKIVAAMGPAVEDFIGTLAE